MCTFFRALAAATYFIAGGRPGKDTPSTKTKWVAELGSQFCFSGLGRFLVQTWSHVWLIGSESAVNANVSQGELTENSLFMCTESPKCCLIFHSHHEHKTVKAWSIDRLGLRDFDVNPRLEKTSRNFRKHECMMSSLAVNLNTSRTHFSITSRGFGRTRSADIQDVVKTGLGHGALVVHEFCALQAHHRGIWTLARRRSLSSFRHRVSLQLFRYWARNLLLSHDTTRLRITLDVRPTVPDVRLRQPSRASSVADTATDELLAAPCEDA